MQVIKDSLNSTAELLEEAQNEIRLVIKNSYLKRTSKVEVERLVKQIVNKAIKSIKIPRLRESAYKSLWAFANSQRNIWLKLGITPELLLFLGQTNSTEKDIQIPKNNALTRELETIKAIPETNKGVPLRQYYKDVWDKSVKPMLDKLVKGVALDPNDYTGRNSLRNLAEMEVRYNDHLESIENFKANGVKLVVCSSHQDCSDRCAPYQGRIFSLDNTSGEIDGHKYVPLEVATEHFYTTKAGITYKNGLLGFNCRHKLEEYRGKLLATISAKERKKEYNITKQQRELERAVRKARVQELMLKDIDLKGYKEAKIKAKAFYERYKQFSQENKRAYYPDRVEI